MQDLPFLALAADPNLIPGIYNACDHWCHYCPATDRCLAFKCMPAHGNGNIYENIEQKMRESMRLLRDCYDAEGLQPPEELLRLLDAPRPTRLEPVNDGLERMAKHYAALATVYLASRAEPLPEMPIPKHEHGPTPFEVFLYYHVFITVKLYRAIISARQAARTGAAHARWDSDVSAKVALIGIERSDEALLIMAMDDDDERIPQMRKHLSRLKREVMARFPAALTLVRPGLDALQTAASDDVDQQEDDGDDEQDMQQAAQRRLGNDAEQPEDDEDHDDGHHGGGIIDPRR